MSDTISLPTSLPTPDSGAPYPHRWKMLAVMCLALVITSLDTLIVTVALPSIERDLGAGLQQLQWVVAAYSLAFSAPLLFAGGLADKFGRRRSFLVGLVVLLFGSLVAAISGSVEQLIGSRVLMGLGAAFIMPSTLSLIRHVFPSDERAKAVGIWVAMGSVGVPFGPIIGGILLESFSWGSIFLINVPLVAVAIAGCLAFVPESRNLERTPLDLIGLTLSVLGPLALVYGIIEAPVRGWASPLILSLILSGLVLIAGFLAWERRTTHPMLSAEVFRNRYFGGPLITIASVFFGVFGGLFIVTQHLQFTLGYEPFRAGLHMLAMCSVVLVAPVSPRLVERLGLGAVTSLGPVMVAAGLLVLALGSTPGSLQVLVSLALMGMGIGLGAPASVDSIMAATPENQTGAGSAVADVALQFGGALGIAILGSAAAAATGDQVTDMALPAIAGAAFVITGAIAVRLALPGRSAAPATVPGE